MAAKSAAALVGTSPLMRQYLAIKGQHEDAILFFRMGDFYEMFFEDAEVAARELDLTLTARDKNADEKVPLCGFPHHQVKTYVHRLLERGFKVAICDQTEDPKESRKAGKTIVERAVTRVLTPGLVLDEEGLQSKAPAWLAAVARLGGRGAAPSSPKGAMGSRVGLAFLDITTGALDVTEVDGDEEAWAEIGRVGPRELLLVATGADARATADPMAPMAQGALPPLPVTPRAPRDFELARAGEVLKAQLGVVTLDGQGLSGMDAAIAAAGAALMYARDNARNALAHVRKVRPYWRKEALLLDEATRKNLEVFEASSGGRRGSLIDVVDGTVTAMGARCVRGWLAAPLMDVAGIAARLEAVEVLLGAPLAREVVRTELAAVYDLPRIVGRVATGLASPRDLKSLRESLERLPALRKEVGGVRGGRELPGAGAGASTGTGTRAGTGDIGTLPLPTGGGRGEGAPRSNRLDAILAQMDPCADICADLRDVLAEDPPMKMSDGGVVRTGFDRELDEINSIASDARGFIVAIETRERERTGINSLKVRFNKVFGYYIEITTSNLGKVPADYLRKQTTSGGERYYTPELKSFEEKVLHADEKRLAREAQIFDALRARVATHVQRLLSTGEAVAELDALAGFAERAHAHGWIRPTVDAGDVIDIVAGRHPVIELMGLSERFVPNDVHMDGEARLLILTGPNMAGKSTVMRQTALLSLMAQTGCFVPAKRAVLGIVDRIFTRVGASDLLSRGQSTFMVEMSETANILHNATERSLVVIDEIGRGTSTFDGVSIAWAVAEHLHDVVKAKTLFATHYHELTALSTTKVRARNFHVAVKEWNEQIIFLRTLVEGATSRSYGIQVARLAGLPDGVLARAREVLADMTGTSPAPRLPHAGMKKNDSQLSLFASASEADALRAEIRALDLDRMTPLEALAMLAKLKNQS